MSERKVLVTFSMVAPDLSGIFLFFAEGPEEESKEGRFIPVEALGGKKEDPNLESKLQDIVNKFNGFVKDGASITPIENWQPKYINIVD